MNVVTIESVVNVLLTCSLQYLLDYAAANVAGVNKTERQAGPSVYLAHPLHAEVWS